MFYIDPTGQNVVDAEATHYKYWKCFVRRKTGQESCTDPSCPVCSSGMRKVKNLFTRIERFLSDPFNLEMILRGTPENLFDINIEFWTYVFPIFNFEEWLPHFNRRNIAENSTYPQRETAVILFKFIDQINKIFDYEHFSDKDNEDYNAYDLTRVLDRHTCTYCNRSYTSTVIRKDGKRIVRPTLDHWFPKSVYPLLAVSFYNLIPSCYPCNSSVKGDDTLIIGTDIHPYVEPSQTTDFAFGYAYSTKLDQYRIFLQDTQYGQSKARKTMEKLFVQEIYNSHHSELRDLLLIRKNYSNSYIKSVKSLFGNHFSDEEVYRLLFGTEFSTKDFYKRPLSKFKYDILKQLRMLEGIGEKENTNTA